MEILCISLLENNVQNQFLYMKGRWQNSDFDPSNLMSIL